MLRASRASRVLELLALWRACFLCSVTKGTKASEALCLACLQPWQVCPCQGLVRNRHVLCSEIYHSLPFTFSYLIAANQFVFSQVISPNESRNRILGYSGLTPSTG
jgi:hypothetical protein